MLLALGHCFIVFIYIFVTFFPTTGPLATCLMSLNDQLMRQEP
jgi:hypothetical protein